jgi:hypothetical protein
MAEQPILSYNGLLFPQNHNYNFANISKSIFDRYYNQYIHRLQAVGYTFPSPAHYQTQFGEPIGSSLIITDNGSTINPPYNYRWLVFHSVGVDHPVSVLIARTIVLDGKFVVLLGENPQGVYIKLEAEDVISVVTVPLTHVEAMGQSVSRV